MHSTISPVAQGCAGVPPVLLGGVSCACAVVAANKASADRRRLLFFILDRFYNVLRELVARSHAFFRQDFLFDFVKLFFLTGLTRFSGFRPDFF